jgi:peptidoglycan/xylan/chitin deacetylase (PgdA/CDA1 family)
VRVALTFDAEHPDRPRCSPGVHDGIVETLAARDVRATFFLQGRWVQAFPATARRMVDEGHLIGSHSFYHARMSTLTNEGIDEDLRVACQVIQAMTGADPRPWFRLPFGDGWDDPRVQTCVEELGYRHVGWDVAAFDWEPDRSPRSIEEAVVAGVRRADADGAAGEAIVLLHGWPDQTLAALPGLIDRLRGMGAELVGVDALQRVAVAAPLL